MKYKDDPGFRHDAPERLGILLSNLGTPDAPTEVAVRRYLAQFLSDPRVVELPRALWYPILHGIILRTRPKRSAKLYRSVWTDEGSPLLVFSRRQAAALAHRLSARFQGQVRVELGMRYGNPSFGSALASLRRANVRRLLVLPLYPQYSATTTASTFDAVTRELSRWRWVPQLRFVTHYHDHPGYIAALAGRIRAYWAEYGEPERLLFSFHGIPREYFRKGDPYYCQCRKTARLTAESLGLDHQCWQVSFQSRVGKKEWLRPYTDQTLIEWGKEGVAKVHAVCPGFSADCLETLEEIAIQGRDLFLGAGGKSFGYVPALNDDPAHVQMLEDLVLAQVSGWTQGLIDEDSCHGPVLLAQRLARAREQGAEH